jgi:hypothetical protein
MFSGMVIEQHRTIPPMTPRHKIPQRNRKPVGERPIHIPKLQLKLNPLQLPMTDLATQYISGECESVRDALKASINANSTPQQLAIAISVADEFVRRAVRNLSRLYDALLAVGYQFTDATSALLLNDPADEHSVTAFEKQMGKMPLLASRWYRRIKSADFRQTYEQLTDRKSPLAGLGWNVPFIVQSLEKAWEHWAEHLKRSKEDDRHRENFGHPPSVPPAPVLLTGGCASNNDCKGFALPSSRFDEVLYNDGGGDQYFGDEIAHGFAQGAFPALQAPERIMKIVRSLYGEPDRAYLSTRLPANYEAL